MLRALRVPLSWKELAQRTYREALADNCLGLAAQLAFYFFLALFPALLFVVTKENRRGRRTGMAAGHGGCHTQAGHRARELPVEPRPRVSDGVLTGLVLSETAFLAYMKLRSRVNKVRS